MTNPIATPCRVERIAPFRDSFLIDAEDNQIGLIAEEENADALCLYINSHDALVEALRKIAMSHNMSDVSRSLSAYDLRAIAHAVLARIEKGV